MTGRADAESAVERVLADLWRCQRDLAARPGVTAIANNEQSDDGAGRAASRAVQLLARQFGEQAMDCVSASMRGDRATLVRGSAVLVELLFALWAETGLEPREVWTELHKREQLGTLLMQLNHAQNQLPRRVLKPWRVDSTKLP